MVRARGRTLAWLLLCGAMAACHRGTAPRHAPAATPIAPIPPSIAGTPADDDEPAPRPLRRCFPERASWTNGSVSELLDHAGELFDADDFVGALACAEEASRQAPRSVEAHHDRAAALLHLGRMDEARDALSLALALDPDDAETLEASADLFINQLSPSSDHASIGLEHARRGFRRSIGRDRQRAARLALLEGQALIDLGRSEEGLRRLDAALSFAPRSTAAQYEKGVALFELCRFDDARHLFERVLAEAPDNAHALYHLGLIDERTGNDPAAEHHLQEASTRDPSSFPPPPPVTSAGFAERVRKAVAELPADVRADLERARVETAEIPALDDLVAEKPPLSPTILGLFRGLPLGFPVDADTRTQAGRAVKGRRGSAPSAHQPEVDAEAEPAAEDPRCAVAPERTIVLYRKNLLRSVRTPAELDAAISRTLLHEVGHLRGEDDGSLRDRGLE